MQPKVDLPPIDARIARLAATQHGLVTRGQLQAAGLGAGAIAHRIRLGRLHRVHRGVYSVGHTLLSGDGRYLAAVLSFRGGAALSHRSAADLWGIRPTSSAGIEVTVPTQAGRKSRPGVRLHRSSWLPPTEVTVERRIPTTTPARTLLDIAGALRPQQLERAVDRAEALRLLDLQAMQSVLARGRGRKGSGVLASIIAEHEVTGPAKNHLEELFLELCAAHHLPRPKVNAWVCGYEVDFLWPNQRVIVETDGRATHATLAGFERDRARDARLTAAGYRVMRFTWRQVTRDPAFVVATLRAVLEERLMTH